MPESLECLIGQLLSSTKSLQHEMTELKADIKEDLVAVSQSDSDQIAELQRTVNELQKTVNHLVGLKNKGAGILIAVSAFSAFLSWCVTHYFK